MQTKTQIFNTIAIAALTLGALTTTANAGTHIAPKAKASFTQGMDMMKGITSSVFKGVEVHEGTVTLTKANGATYLEVSKDFMVPKTPAPSWQVVDAKGNVYLLNQFRIAGDKINTKIKLPSYIMSVAKVQVWCSFAEVNLGEVSFKMAVKTH